jgi:hypothetical protein
LGSNLDKVVSVKLGGRPVPYDSTTFSFTVPDGAVSAPVTVVSAFSEIQTSFVFQVTHDGELSLTSTTVSVDLVVPASLHYLLTVENRGSKTIGQVVLSTVLFRTPQALPENDLARLDPTTLGNDSESGITLMSATASQGSCFIRNQSLRCDLGDLAGSASVAIDLVAQAARSGFIYQLALVQGAEPDPILQDNRAVTGQTVWGVPILSGFSPASGTPGTTVEIHATNSIGSVEENSLEQVTEVWIGSSVADFTYDTNRFVLLATVPGNPNATGGPISIVTPVAFSVSSNSFTILPEAVVTGFSPNHGAPGTVVQPLGTNLDQVISINFGTAKASVTYSDGASFTVPPDALSGPPTIQMPHSWQPSTNSFIVNRPLDLGLSETCAASNGSAPTTLTYTMTVLNKGPEAMDSVVVTNAFYRSEQFVSDLPIANDNTVSVSSAVSGQGQCSVSGTFVRCELERLEAFATATLTITLQANGNGFIHHLAGIEAADADPDPHDNTLHSVTPVLGPAQLALTRVGARRVEIRWPSLATNYVLQFREPATGSAWVSLAVQPLDTGAWKTVQDTMSTTGRIYRLLRPNVTGE